MPSTYFSGFEKVEDCIKDEGVLLYSPVVVQPELEAFIGSLNVWFNEKSQGRTVLDHAHFAIVKDLSRSSQINR